jgi:4-amino-4-deoxy-L-arabinose transferase
MLATGDFLHPTLAGEPHLTKPPGAYWIIAAGLALFGRNEFGARFFGAVALVVSAWCVRAIGARLFGAASGSRAGWIFLSMLLPVAAGNTVSTDIYLTALGLGAIAFLVRSWTADRPGAWLAGSWALLGGAFLVKGPPAVLPFAGVVAGWLLGGRRLSPGRRWISVPGALLFVVIALGWFAWMVAEDPSRADSWWRGEVVDRVLTDTHNRSKAIWFYPAVLVAGTLPWTWLAAKGLARSWASPQGRLALGWFALPVLVFLLSVSKMWFYMVPVAAPLALFAAQACSRREEPLPARAPFFAAWLVLVAAVRTSVAFVEDDRDMRRLRREVAAVDPRGELPVALISGRDSWGLLFEFDGDLRLLEDPVEVRRKHPHATVAEEVARLRARGQDWIAVVEEDDGERALRREAGAAAEEVRRFESWRVYRVRAR